jgi:hypothetical protein
MSLCHKSGSFISVLFLMAMFQRNFMVTPYLYKIAIIVMFVCMFVPIEAWLVSLLENLPKNAVVNSILHHFDVTENFQFVYFLYIVLAVVLYLISKNKQLSFETRLVFFMFVLLALLCKNWFLLNRVRSYFIPLFLYYIFTNLDCLESKLSKQISYAVTTMYIMIVSVMLYRSIERAESRINYPQTIFSLLNNSEDEILKQTVKKNIIFWKEEYDFHD